MDPKTQAQEKVQIVHPLINELKNTESNDLQRRFSQIKSTQGMGSALALQLDVQKYSMEMRHPCMSVQKNHLGREVLLGKDIELDFGDYLSLAEDREIDGSRMF